MQIPYPLYYRKHGIRRAVQLVAPPLGDETTLSLPRDAVLHYLSEEESLYGIPQDQPLIRSIQRLIYVDSVTQLVGTKGPPRPTRIPASTMIRQYHRLHRRTRKLINLEAALRDPRSLLVENYALLPHLYRYTKSFFSTYYKWVNIQETLWAKVEELTKITERQQFLLCRVPEVLPQLADLKRGERGMSRSALARFTDHDSLFLLEMWKWLGADRESSVLGQLSKEALDRMNLLFVESGRWFVVNLGKLDAWRKPTQEELEEGDGKGGSISAMAMQKRYLRLLMFLTEFRSDAGGNDENGVSGDSEVIQKKAPAALGTTPTASEIPEAPKSEGSKLDPLPELGLPNKKNTAAAPTEPTPEAEATTSKVVIKPLTLKVNDPDSPGKTKRLVLKPGMDIDNLPIDPIEETPENIQAIDDAITKDLEALNHLQLGHAEENDGDGIPEVAEKPVYEPQERSLEAGVMKKADALADQGLLSGAEYRRFTALSEAYKKLPDPYGKDGSLEEHLTIPKSALVLEDHKDIPDNDGVFDKSMLKSRLFDFDKQYITEVMAKDISNVVMSLQNAGIAVSGYDVERQVDAMNDYTMHTVHLVPVRGKPSTIHFKIPTVREDGTFDVNNTRCIQRKQRGDLPLRKVTPSKVALTSYYSKIFVTRSEKKVHDYAGWLTDHIAALGMDGKNDTITNLMVSDVFDTNTHVPRMYSILAKRFRSFTYNGPTEISQNQISSIHLFLDYHAREKEFGKELVKASEKKGWVLVGTYRVSKNTPKAAGWPVVMDPQGVLYTLKVEAKDADVLVLGDLVSLLGLDASKAPLEVTEVKVFGKKIPVGLFLAYEMGLEKLINTLKAEPRHVPLGERLHLEDDEFALRFSDETLVFTKDHSLASMILSGLSTYNELMQNYSISVFEKKDIYASMLDRSGLGARYVREMDLLMDMFVDPITKEILESMGEPTDFIGLLLRASELLLTDWSPDETDLAYMRIKGYERMAGMVYGELVKAVRIQRARGTKNATIDIPPYQIWQAISQDPSVRLVEESNPVHSLKEQEEITYTGQGGRTSRSMVGNTRLFHKNDMGVISEATKDSSDVAVTTFLTADPNFKGVRGLSTRYEEGKVGAASLLSTSALLAPAADRDD